MTPSIPLDIPHMGGWHSPGSIWRFPVWNVSIYLNGFGCHILKVFGSFHLLFCLLAIRRLKGVTRHEW
eukprot:4411683-Amphidinium_carterae.1